VSSISSFSLPFSFSTIWGALIQASSLSVVTVYVFVKIFLCFFSDSFLLLLRLKERNLKCPVIRIIETAFQDLKQINCASVRETSTRNVILYRILKGVQKMEPCLLSAESLFFVLHITSRDQWDVVWTGHKQIKCKQMGQIKKKQVFKKNKHS
jgi:hypothetical protein